jgi:hypothetical protein
MGDYEDFLRSVGLTAQQVWEISNNSTDRIPFDRDYAVVVLPSDIQGLGLFSAKCIDIGESICPATVGDKRTPAGRYMNHSAYPNTHLEYTKDGFYVVAKENIGDGDELTVDYKNNLKLLRRANMNEEQLVALGTDAEALLATEAFTKTMNIMVDATVQAFLGSAPDEESKRTEAYAHYRALVDIVNTLRQQVEVRDQINTKDSEENEVITEEE